MQSQFDLIGLFAFAISGALMAIRHDLDVVGIALLAVITALGGGIMRDIILGDTPPAAFTHWEYLTVALAGAAVAFVAHPQLERATSTLLVFDAAGLGLFGVSGTVEALDHGLSPIAAATVGVTTAVGGGLLRDAITQQTPMIIRSGSELYAIPIAAGALATAVVWELDAYRVAIGFAIAAAVFGVRLLAIHRHWRGPSPRRRAS